MNLMGILNQLRGSGNPQKMVEGMLQKQMGNNPIANNAMGMFKNQDMSGLEQLARNIGKQKGIDVDQLMQQIRGGMGM